MKSLKINDIVLVIAGSHKGTEAKIVKIDRAKGVAMLEGIGVREKTIKRTQFNPRGGKKIVHLGIDLSNLKLKEAAQPVKSAVKKVDKSRSRAGKKTGFLSRGDDDLSARSADKEAKKAKKETKKVEKEAKKGAK
ncbi:50S ribosomal protein L24 [Candidatus Saccharibacteria bacterium]|nr:50S ribosomal protein L24 [Candidatus Saccharibacteria bacterium]